MHVLITYQCIRTIIMLKIQDCSKRIVQFWLNIITYLRSRNSVVLVECAMPDGGVMQQIHPHNIMQTLLHSAKCMVWCSLSRSGIAWLLFYDTVSSDHHLHELQQRCLLFFWGMCERTRLALWMQCWMCTMSIFTTEHFAEQYECVWFWPPYRPGLIPLHLFLRELSERYALQSQCAYK